MSIHVDSLGQNPNCKSDWSASWTLEQEYEGRHCMEPLACCLGRWDNGDIADTLLNRAYIAAWTLQEQVATAYGSPSLGVSLLAGDLEGGRGAVRDRVLVEEPRQAHARAVNDLRTRSWRSSTRDVSGRKGRR